MCSVIDNSNVYVNNNTLSLDPTPKPHIRTPISQTCLTKGTYTEAANALLSTVNIDIKNIHEWAIMDSGATSHFLVTKAPTRDRQVAISPLKVRLPDGAQVASTHTCQLDIPNSRTKRNSDASYQDWLHTHYSQLFAYVTRGVKLRSLKSSASSNIEDK